MTRRYMSLCKLIIVGSFALSMTTSFSNAADRKLEAALARSLLTLNSLDSTSRDNGYIGLLTDDSLLYIDPDTRKVVPLMAKSYSVVDSKTIDVVIRDDITFHDGSKLTTDDVVYSFNSWIDPNNSLVRANTFRRWLASVEKTTPDTVRFHLVGPDPLALQYLAVDGKVVRSGTFDRADGTKDYTLQSTSLVSTGPYRVVSFQPGEDLLLERFEGYHRDSPKGFPQSEQIHFRVIPEYATQAAEIVAGNLDWANDVPTEIAEQAASYGENLQLIAAPSMRIGYIVLDAKGKSGAGNPITNVNVRRALSMAIDRDMIAKQLVGGSAHAVLTPCLPVQFGCDQTAKTYAYDPTAAKALLAEAGYAKGFDLELWSSRAGTQEPLQAVVNMWREIGVRANLRFVESSALTKARDAGQLSAFFDNNGSQGIADVNALLPNQFMESSPNAFHGDPKVYDLISRLTTTIDPAAREKIAKETVNYINENVYWIPLYEFPSNFLTSSRIVYPQAADGMQRLYLTTWKD